VDRPSSERALVTQVQRFSLHDGPGVRTTVFFKGCPLRCRWCQNPETQRPTNELAFTAEACAGCGRCVERCGRGALQLRRRGLALDWRRCDHCLACVDPCPSRALEAAGRWYDLGALQLAALADRPFFGASGGVTLSGGEPLLQAAFLRRWLPMLRAERIHVVVQTCGVWRWEEAADVLEQVDLIQFDLKAASPRLHHALTGVDNQRLLGNLRALLGRGAKVELRAPLVPDLNSDPDELATLADLVSGLGAQRIVLLPYHRLWESKLSKLDTRQRRLGVGVPTQAWLRRCAAVFEARGLEAVLPQD
jgi:pyruvate formate lyase activating enzyme